MTDQWMHMPADPLARLGTPACCLGCGGPLLPIPVSPRLFVGVPMLVDTDQGLWPDVAPDEIAAPPRWWCPACEGGRG